MNVVFSSLILALFFIFPVSQIKAEKINLGMVDKSPSKMSKRFTPFLEYLRKQGIDAGKVITTKSFAQMSDKIKDGKVQFMFESPYGALEIMDKSGAIPILIREKKGVKQYNSCIFVPKNSPIKALGDLRGKVIAFEEAESTSSFYLPRGILQKENLELVESRKPIAGKVAYYFTKDDSNTIAQVKKGKKAQAGGIKVSKVKDDKNFRILPPESPMVPRHVVLVAKTLDTSKLMSVLLSMKNSKEGKKVLTAIKTPTGFSKFDDDPFIAMNKTVRSALGK